MLLYFSILPLYLCDLYAPSVHMLLTIYTIHVRICTGRSAYTLSPSTILGLAQYPGYPEILFHRGIGYDIHTYMYQLVLYIH